MIRLATLDTPLQNDIAAELFINETARTDGSNWDGSNWDLHAAARTDGSNWDGSNWDLHETAIAA